jgi:hypothetical protein
MGKSELEIKEEMASRLSLMCAADENLKTLLLSMRIVVNPCLAKTKAECMPVDYLTNQALEVDFLGIVNGLVGDNKYTIVPVYNEKRLVGFTVRELQNNLSVNSNKQIEE